MLKIGICDDNVEIRRLLHSFCERFFGEDSCVISQYASGEEFFEKGCGEEYPDILLLDEPFSALDYQTRLSVCDDIGQILRDAHKTAVLVTHDLSEAVSMADRVIILTARPAAVAKVVPITFELEEDTPMNRRNAPEFKHYFNIIWKELNTNA